MNEKVNKEYYNDWFIPEQYQSRIIEIDTEEFGLIEISEEEYYKNYSLVK